MFVPFGNVSGRTSIQVVGQPAPDPRRVPIADINVITPEFFAIMRMPVLSGRAFGARDVQNGRLVTIVNDAFVAQYLKGLNPIGQQVRLSKMKNLPAEIVGVVGEIRMDSDPHRGNPQAYVPFAQSPTSDAYLVVRRPPEALPEIRRRLAEIDATQPMFDAKSMDDRLAEALAPYQIISGMLVWFSLLALVLASVGIYGMVAFSVSQRTREIGIRAALGAGRGALLRLLLRQGVWMLAAGLGIGMPASWAASAGLRGLFADALPSGVAGPLMFTAAVMCLAVLLAVVVPARRAAATDPLAAIRYE
jgi:ABC-type antimicrobial peptide transport system permease subunit